MSIKLAFGMAAGLILGAILFGKANHPTTTVKELPAWSNSGASPAVTPGSIASVAPAWTPPAPVAAAPVSQSQIAPAVVSPQPPQLGENRPAPPSGPAWSQPSPKSNAATSPGAVGAGLPDRSGALGADPRDLQADSRNDVARFNDPRYDYRGSPAPVPANRPASPASGAGDYRYSDAGASYTPAANPGNPRMPSTVPTPATMDRYSQDPDPGVARFEGTIAAPPARTNYDRAGSSNH